MTTSSRINSKTDLHNVDETRGNISVDGGDLLVNDKNFDQQSHTHHKTVQVKQGKVLFCCQALTFQLS